MKKIILISFILFSIFNNISAMENNNAELPELPLEMWDMIIEIGLIEKINTIPELNKKIIDFCRFARTNKRNYQLANQILIRKIKSNENKENPIHCFYAQRKNEIFHNIKKEIINAFRYLNIEWFTDINAKDTCGNSTILLYIPQKEYFEIFKLLIKNGANVNFQNSSGTTPLMKAVRDYKDDVIDREIIKLLIQNGADMSVKDMYGQTVFDISRHNQHHEKIVELIHNEEKLKNLK